MGTELPYRRTDIALGRVRIQNSGGNVNAKFWVDFLNEEQGQDLIEYTLVAALTKFTRFCGLAILHESRLPVR